MTSANPTGQRRRTRLATGIYQDQFGISIMASIGSKSTGTLQVSPEIRRPLDTALDACIALWHREKMRLKDAYAKSGGRVQRGSLAEDVRRYFETAELSKQEERDRRFRLAWWCQEFGKRTRASLEPHELQRALKSLRCSPSRRNKYRTALSNVFTVLDGKSAANPFREFEKFEEPEALPRDQPYDVIDAIFHHMRDRGRGKKPSITKARYLVLAKAPITPAQLWALSRGDVDFEAGTMRTTGRLKGEGTRGKGKPLTPEALTAFRLFDAADGWEKKGSHGSMWRTFDRARWKAVAKLRKANPHRDLSKVEKMRPYDFKHSLATLALRTTGDLNIVAELYDHKDPKTTKRYSQAAIPELLQKASDKIAAALAARPAYTPPPATLPSISSKQARHKSGK